MLENAEETDMRISLDCVHLVPETLIYSPDTDVYNTGLPIAREHSSLDV